MGQNIRSFFYGIRLWCYYARYDDNHLYPKYRFSYYRQRYFRRIDNIKYWEEPENEQKKVTAQRGQAEE